MAWLLREGEVLAAVQEGRRWPSDEGAVLRRGILMHTVGAGGRVDVAWCRRVTEDGKSLLLVRRLSCVGSNRILGGPPGRVMVVASEGAFERWRLQVGDRLELRAP